MKLNNVPDFRIESAKMTLDDELFKLDLRDMISSSIQKKQCTINIKEDINYIDLYVCLKNISNSSAFDIETLESQRDLKRREGLYKIGKTKYNKIEGKEYLTLSYHINLDKLECQNGVKIFSIEFSLNYRNMYGHYFYNAIRVCLSWSEPTGLVIDLTLCEQEEGKVRL